jgi:hypothetical protein
MTSDLDSVSFSKNPDPREDVNRWVQVGFVAVASALAGGLAAAWWYRKTLSRLQEAEESANNPQFGISDDGTEGE